MKDQKTGSNSRKSTSQQMTLLIRNGFVVTMNRDREIIEGDILVQGSTIQSVGQIDTTEADHVINAAGRIVIPGLVQSHIHLCQALFRNMADDLSLLDWLRKKIWPLEAAHNEESIRASARLGLLELLRGGTTAIQDMATVHHTNEVFEEIEKSGIRAVSGKCMMDRPFDLPRGLQETTRESIDESLRLYEKWDGAAGGRIGYVFAPRFAISCTEDLLKHVGRLSTRHGIAVHSHASENRREVELVKKLYSRENIQVFSDTSCTDFRLGLAHCIWTSPEEQTLLADKGVHVLHCPGSNLKLGSGFCRVPEFLEQGISVSIGADGAPCNNNLDAFNEMRLAALIQKPRLGPDALSAQAVFEMATLGGARALGLEKRVGSIEPGKAADLAILDLNRPHAVPAGEVYGRLVYSAKASDVTHTIVDGKILFSDNKVHTINEVQCLQDVTSEIPKILDRSSL